MVFTEFASANDVRWIRGKPTVQVKDLHQIEITSRCNLRCVYCVHPHMPRAKEDMTEEVFLQSLKWAKHFHTVGTRVPGGDVWKQKELNLAGIGESTIHPRFVEFIHLARDIVGPDMFLTLAT